MQLEKLKLSFLFNLFRVLGGKFEIEIEVKQRYSNTKRPSSRGKDKSYGEFVVDPQKNLLLNVDVEGGKLNVHSNKNKNEPEDAKHDRDYTVNMVYVKPVQLTSSYFDYVHNRNLEPSAGLS